MCWLGAAVLCGPVRGGTGCGLGHTEGRLGESAFRLGRGGNGGVDFK